MPEIPDDPAGLEDVLKDLKQNFRTGATLSSRFREQALTNLINGYETLKN